MSKKCINIKGLSLVEIIIIMVIIGILAAVAVPIYKANINKVKAMEAEECLGAIRTSLRVYYAAYDCYPISDNYVNITSVAALDLSDYDLTGKYYHKNNYYYKSVSGTAYLIKAEAKNSPTFFMDATGNFVLTTE